MTAFQVKFGVLDRWMKSTYGFVKEGKGGRKEGMVKAQKLRARMLRTNTVHAVTEQSIHSTSFAENHAV